MQRPRECEERAGAGDLDRVEQVPSESEALWALTRCWGNGTGQLAEMWPFLLHLKQRPSLILFFRSLDPFGA